MDEVRSLKRVAFDHFEAGNVHFQDNMYEKARKSYEKSLIVSKFVTNVSESFFPWKMFHDYVNYSRI